MHYGPLVLNFVSRAPLVLYGTPQNRVFYSSVISVDHFYASAQCSVAGGIMVLSCSSVHACFVNTISCKSI